MQKNLPSPRIQASRALLVLLGLWLFRPEPVCAQNDSLLRVWKNEKLHDTIRLQAISSIAWNYLYSNPDSAFLFAQKAVGFSRQRKLAFWEANSLNTVGAVYYIKGDYPKALEYYLQSVAIKEKIGDKKSLARSWNNIGLLLQEQGSYVEALQYYLKSLKLKEELNDEKGLAVTYSNIGMIYQYQKRYTKSLDFHFRSLDLETRLKNEKGMSDCYNNIGVVYDDRKDMFNALKYFLKSLEIREKINDVAGMADSYTNIGFIFSQQTTEVLKRMGMSSINKYARAEEYYNKALKLYTQLGNEKGITIVYNNLGKLELLRKNPDRAISWCRQGNEISIRIGILPQQVESCGCLYEAYKAKGEGMLAVKYMEKYYSLRDTINNHEKEKQLLLIDFQYEYDKKTTRDSVIHAEAQKRKDLEIDRQKAMAETERAKKYALYGGLVVVLLFAVFLFTRFRVIRKQKILIEDQKQEVDQKNRDITDSISYAHRIQEAMLPESHLIRKGFPEHFLFMRPRDIVSGDFYWYKDFGNIHALSVADCTGHGVPGALMSMMGGDLLDFFTNSSNYNDPASVFIQLDDHIHNTLSRRGEENRDGMDLGLVTWKPDTRELYFSGANRPLIQVRNGVLTAHEYFKSGVGGTIMQKKFFTRKIDVRPGDMFYMFSDGYQDQFGGEKGKKFMSRNFLELLVTVSSFPVEEQRKKLEETLLYWKGNYEQVDDICVIGFRL